MSPPTPEQIDAYIESLVATEDDALRAANAAAAEAGLPEIQVSPVIGKLLMVLARTVNASRILEVGTLAGYSSIWLARAIDDSGELVTLELDPHHAEVARANLSRANLACTWDVRVGPAGDALDALQGPFDFVFIDADKAGYPEYLGQAIRLTRPGGLIVADNVIRAGRVLGPAGDPSAEGANRFNRMIAEDDRVDASIIQVTGRKGHDGLAILRVR